MPPVRPLSPIFTAMYETDEARTAGETIDEVGPTEPTDRPATSLWKRMLKRFGVAGFIFFFLKGLILWVLIPLGLFRWFGGCE